MSLLQYTRLIIATCLLSVGLSSQAAVFHIVENGQLVGATGVEVDGALYDVAFTDGTFDSLYPSGIPTFHASQADATLFSQALLDSVFIDLVASGQAFDTNPQLTAGCDDGSNCDVYVPFGVINTVFEYAWVSNDSDELFDQVVSLGIPIDRNLATASDLDGTFAVFTPVAAIPEPSTYAMLASGLFTLAGFSRRSNRV